MLMLWGVCENVFVEGDLRCISILYEYEGSDVDGFCQKILT